MMPKLLWLMCFALSVNANFINPPKKEGQTCKTVRGALWTCTKASECSVYAKLQTSKHLAICSKADGEFIVCCPKNARVVKRESVSNKKCQEYQSKICINNRPSLVHSSQGGSMDDYMEEKPEEGWENPDVGIFGGTRVLPGEFPYSALIGYGEENSIQWHCGGTLISENFVLTAAHCTNSTTRGLARWVLLGDVDYTTTFEEEGAQKFQIVERVVHDQWKEALLYHDVALFRLDRNVVFTQYVAPACLYEGRSNPPGQGIAVGWGWITATLGSSEAMLKTFLDFVPADQCEKTMSTLYRVERKLPLGIIDSMICAYKTKKAMCRGDSGSGIVVADKGDECFHRLAGVMAFTGGCDEHKIPAGFMRVASYLPWIEETVWPSAANEI